MAAPGQWFSFDRFEFVGYNVAHLDGELDYACKCCCACAD